VVLSHYRSLPKGIRHLVYLWQLWRKARGVSAIYAYDALGAGLPAVLVARLRGKKLVIRIGGDIPWERASGSGETELSMLEWYQEGRQRENLNFKLSRWVIRRADQIITVSDLLSRLYIEHYGVPAERVITLPNPVPERGGVSPSHTTLTRDIIFASRLVKYKNLSLVLRVLSRVLPEYTDVRFVIMGDGPEREALEGQARSLGLGGKVVFTGLVPETEVSKRTAESYLGLAPALTEFNPNYILQCIAYGKPFLISSEHGMPFEVPERLVFNPRDEADLENKLRNLLDREGYEHAREALLGLTPGTTWESVLSTNLEIIKNVQSQALHKTPKVE